VTQYVLSEGADRDLNGIWEYIAEDNVDAADHWMSRLFDAFDAIAATPGIGHKREDLTAHPVQLGVIATTNPQPQTRRTSPRSLHSW